MMGLVPSRQTGVVFKKAGLFRTLYGENFPEARRDRIILPGILPEDQQAIQAATTQIRELFPQIDWPSWGVEIVEGHDRLAEILPEEQTILLERQGLGELALLSWDLFGAFIQYILTEEYAFCIEQEQVPQVAFIAQLHWFLEENYEWQYEILASLALPGMDKANLAGLLWSLLPNENATRLEVLLREQTQKEHEIFQEFKELPLKERIWQASAHYLAKLYPDYTFSPENQEEEAFFVKLKKVFQVCQLVNWDTLCGPLPGMLVRFYHEINENTNSTERRLSLFRINVEHGIQKDPLRLHPMDWPRLSLVVLNPERHPKIHQALIEFLELSNDHSQSALWAIKGDEMDLARLALRNQLGDQDDRFFRQATHVQAIWRDILHRSSSQDWASELLFNALEKLITIIQQDPDLFFAAVVWNRNMWETSPTPLPPQIENLRELLWVLSQSPLTVLRKLMPPEKEKAIDSRARWPLLTTHLKRFLHLAPPILLRLLEQIEEEGVQKPDKKSPFSHIEMVPDPEIPQQDLQGRILPLLHRPELKQHRWINLQKTKELRIIHLDRHLHQSSGFLKEKRFLSSFLLLFKTEETLEKGDWPSLALWIDKELDLSKLTHKKGLSPTVRGLLLEDGIWERTYRYQFLSMDQLLHKLQPSGDEWNGLLRLLITEYKPLLEKRVQELLDYQFYSFREQYLHENTLTEQLFDVDCHPFFQQTIEDFEGTKPTFASRVVELASQHFSVSQFQDSRSWQNTHKTLIQMMRRLSELLRIPPGDLLIPTEEKTGFRHWIQQTIENWSQHNEIIPVETTTQSEWKQNKLSLLERLQNFYPQGAVQFVRFLLQQIRENYQVTEFLMEQPFTEQEKAIIFKPIPTPDERSARKRELVPYLKDDQENILSPAYLELLTHIPELLLRDTIEQYPELLSPLRKAASLLRELDQDSEHHLSFWNILESLRTQHVEQEKAASAREKMPRQSDLPDLEAILEDT